MIGISIVLLLHNFDQLTLMIETWKLVDWQTFAIETTILLFVIESIESLFF